MANSVTADLATLFDISKARQSTRTMKDCKDHSSFRKKKGKDDYILPKNYRPTSPLATLEKVIKAVTATRVAYLTEVHKLLPNNHFGARKQRSTIRAISYLQESIFNAWRGRKTLWLASFDVKGA